MQKTMQKRIAFDSRVKTILFDPLEPKNCNSLVVAVSRLLVILSCEQGLLRSKETLLAGYDNQGLRISQGLCPVFPNDTVLRFRYNCEFPIVRVVGNIKFFFPEKKSFLPNINISDHL